MTDAKWEHYLRSLARKVEIEVYLREVKQIVNLPVKFDRVKVMTIWREENVTT